MGWQSGQTPWIRRQNPVTPIQCLFCGEMTALLSIHDEQVDPGRLEIYCKSNECAARETVVLVVNDGTSETVGRADVRALDALDRPPSDHGPRYKVTELLELGKNDRDGVVARRRSPAALQLDLEAGR
jgi:hypothetical protein